MEDDEPMLFITQWQADRLSGALATPPHPTDEDPDADSRTDATDDHLSGGVPARV